MKHVWMSTVAMLWLGSLACSERPAGDDDGVSTTDPSGDSNEEGPSQTGSTDGEAGSTDGEAGSTDGEAGSTDGEAGSSESTEDEGPGCDPEPKLDLPPELEEAELCTVDALDWTDHYDFENCELCPEIDGGCAYSLYLGCVVPGPGETCADLCPSGNCVGDHWSSCLGGFDAFDSPVDWCGHYEVDAQCCTLGKFIWVCGE